LFQELRVKISRATRKNHMMVWPAIHQCFPNVCLYAKPDLVGSWRYWQNSKPEMEIVWRKDCLCTVFSTIK